VVEAVDPVGLRFGGLVMIYGTLMTSLSAADRGAGEFRHRSLPDGAVAKWLKRRSALRSNCSPPCPRSSTACGPARLRATARGVRAAPLQAAFGDVPGLGTLFTGPPVGIGILSAGIILAIMIIPFIAATMRDVFD